MDSCSGWFAQGRDPSGELTECIEVLKRYPFETYLQAATHLNRIAATIYLTDQLTGRHLETIRSLRAVMPPPGSALAAAHYEQLDGLIAALESKSESAVAILQKVASWFQDRELLADAAVCLLQLAWAALVVDSSAAAQAAKTAYTYMERTGFRSQGLEKVALKIYQDARHNELSRQLLRRGILLTVCPGIEARLSSEAEPS